MFCVKQLWGLIGHVGTRYNNTASVWASPAYVQDGQSTVGFFYGTGGFAYARFKEDAAVSCFLVGSYSGINTQTGWTAALALKQPSPIIGV